jgi:hypothetical protein
MERIQHPEITPLEISDLWVKGGTLWEWSRDPGFTAALRTALVVLRAGRADLPSREPLPELVLGYEAVFVTGGRSADCELRDSLSTLPFAVAFVEQPVFGVSAEDSSFCSRAAFRDGCWVWAIVFTLPARVAADGTPGFQV